MTTSRGTFGYSAPKAAYGEKKRAEGKKWNGKEIEMGGRKTRERSKVES